MWRRRDNFQRLLGDGMQDGQSLGVQREAADEGALGLQARVLILALDLRKENAFGRSIQGVGDDDVADAFEMDANLMGASRERLDLHERMLTEGFKHLDPS